MAKETHLLEKKSFQDTQTIRKVLTQMRRIAMVGISANEARPSYFVGYYLKRMGYNVLPVNPRYTEILGVPCYQNLAAISKPPEVVNVFRRPEDIEGIVEEAIFVGAKALWLQDGVISEEASEIAQTDGLLFVMNDCMLRRHKQLH